MSEPEIRIPENGGITPSEVKQRFDRIDAILAAVVVAVVVALISIVVAVLGIFLDQMRYNNVAYKEYSQKTESVEITQKINEALLEQMQELLEQNKQNRDMIKQFWSK